MKLWGWKFMKTSNSQFEKFDAAMKKLLKIPHAEIKKKLDEEKKRKGSRKSSSSPEANDLP